MARCCYLDHPLKQTPARPVDLAQCVVGQNVLGRDGAVVLKDELVLGLVVGVGPAGPARLLIEDCEKQTLVDPPGRPVESTTRCERQEAVAQC